MGAGSSGVAGIYGLELDVWPIAWLGVGVEFVRGGSTAVSLFEPVESDSFKTERIRISARTRLKSNLFFVATIAGGTARVRLNTVHCSDDCRRNPGEGYGPYNRSEFGSAASGALELGMYTRSDGFHAGFVGRVDLAGPVILLTFGPVLGFGF